MTTLRSLPSEFRRFPRHWRVEPFSEVIADETGGNLKVPKSSYQPTGAFPVIDQGKEAIAGYVDDPQLICKIAGPVILFGDHTRQIKWVDHPFALGADGVKVLVPVPDLDRRFAYHYLRQLRLPIDAGYSRHFKFLKKSFVPVPPLAEQERIAAVLDKADTIRRKRRDQCDSPRILMESIFNELFGQPIDNPNTWPVHRLDEVIADGASVSYGIVQCGPEYPSGVPYIRTSEMVKEELGPLETFSRTAPEIAAKYSRSTVCEGDLVFANRASIGAVVEVPKYLAGANLTQGTTRIAPGPKIHRHYLMWLIRSPRMQQWFDRWAKGATFREITMGKLREAPIPLPPLPLQERFSDIHLAVHQTSERMKLASRESDDLFSSLVQRAFRGDL